MEFNEVIKSRTATRKFSNKKVSKRDLLAILNAGRLAPTAKNMQPQVIFVAQSAEAIKKIDSVTPCRYNAPICLIVCADLSVSWNMNGEENYQVDASIVSTHMMLMATNLGVDNIWIRKFNSNELKQVFNLSKNIEPVCLLMLGHKTSDCPANPMHKVRKPLDETVKYI